MAKNRILFSRVPID